MKGKIIIKGRIIVKTGLHIGGDDSFSAIGGVDNPVIKDMRNKKPYIIFLVVIMLLCSFGLTGCHLLEGTSKICESGDFLYRESNNASFDYINIIGFTKEGRQKTEIVFPKEINNTRVYILGNRGTKGLQSTPTNYFHQEEENYGESLVNKVFVPANVFMESYGYFGCFYGAKIKKTIFQSVYPNLHRVISFSQGDLVYDIRYLCSEVVIIAAGYKPVFEDYYQGRFKEANIQFELNYEIKNLEELIAASDQELLEQLNNYKIAQIDYEIKKNQYRLELSRNEGIYWIDHLDENQTLVTIPQTPTREGFTFAGWFLDKEGTQAADLTTLTPNEDGSTLFLYAKWE